MKRKTRLEYTPITVNKTIKGTCLDILFYNSTSSTVYIGNFPVLSLGTLKFSSNENECIEYNLEINFRGAAGTVHVWTRIDC